MIMSLYRQQHNVRHDVIAATLHTTTNNKAQSTSKSIDKICAKLQLHIDPDKHNNSEVVVENIKKEIVVDLHVEDSITSDKESSLRNNILTEDDIINHRQQQQQQQQHDFGTGECGSDICTAADVDMYSSDNSPKSSYNPKSDSPKSSYNPSCHSPSVIHDNPSMSYSKDSSRSPPNLSPDDSNMKYETNLGNIKYENMKYDESSRHNSSVIVCTHDNTTAMYDNVCPVSPVFVSTHDDVVSMSYDNVHPSSPVIDHYLSKNSVSYTNIRTHSPVVTPIEDASGYNYHNDHNDHNSGNYDHRDDHNSGNYDHNDHPSSYNDHPMSTSTVEGDLDNPSMTMSEQQSPTSPPNNNDKTDGEKTDTKANGKLLKPRHTTQYNNWHHNDMIMAIKAVQMKYLSMTAAAKRYGIPRTTLRHYLHDGTNREAKRACFSIPKKSEDDLVEFALENCHVNEKALYKLIFDKAKEFSQEYIHETGEEGRRIVPTPAWIRRFVYRHKQLHSVFPTFLAKWEHPAVLSDRKLPNDPEDFTKCNGTHENSKHGKDKTEIIFPKGKYDNFYPPPRSYDINGNNRNNDSSADQSQIRGENCIPQPKPSLHPRVGNDIGDGYLDPDSQRGGGGVKNEQFPSDDERIIPYKELLSRISKPPYTSSKMSSSHNSQMLDLNYGPSHRHERKNTDPSKNHHSDTQQQYVNLSSIPIIRSTQYSSKTESTTTSASDIHIENDIDGVGDTNQKDVSYSEKLRSLVKPLSDDPRDAVKFSEFDVMKITLNAMEESLGGDYVQLFTERYCRNKSLERLYGKWVSLRSELDLTD